MNRRDLDAFVAHYRLPAATADIVLDLAAARPTPAELRTFVAKVFQLAGVLSLAAGLVFFIAANWGDIGVAGRFVLVQGVVVTSVALALWKPAPQPLGRYSLLTAFIATGALLALFGQTYQTGADLYELFLTWAGLGLAFVVAGQWSVLSAAWLMVLNVALLLFFGWRPGGGWLWSVFSAWETDQSLMLLAPTLTNAALWGLAQIGRRRGWDAVAPRWVARLALACAFGFMTWAAVIAIVSSAIDRNDVLALFIVLLLQAALVVHAMRQRDDVFPLALSAASFIVISTSALGAHSDLGDIGMAFVLALWLTLSSTLSGRMLMPLVRAWRDGEERT
jgi:uncharacterized membrane protein